MADNLKPYDPNKWFISFRLNPDAIKEEALNLIPWPVGTIAREMYRDPDGSIVETAKQVGRETPVLGSLLSGEYSDAAKEAFLLGVPMRGSSSAAKEALNKYKNKRNWYNYKQDLFYEDSKGNLKNVDKYHKDLQANKSDARKYNDYQEVLNELDLTDKARADAQIISDKAGPLDNEGKGYKVIDDFKANVKVPNNSVVYGVDNGYYSSVIVWDPKKQVATGYYKDQTGTWKVDETLNKKEFNDVKDDFWKDDANYRANYSLERKLLDSDINDFNIKYDVSDDFLPMSKDLPWTWERNYGKNYK